MNEQIVIKTVIQRYVKDEHKVSLVIKEKRKKIEEAKEHHLDEDALDTT